MPKPIIPKGVKFEDALLKMLKTPPMPPLKTGKRASGSKTKRAKN
jgi:hypothetical protein